MLTLGVACDKRAEEPAPRRQLTSLAGRPTVLFLVFGDRADPRLLPIATIGHGRVTPISLDAQGWRNFDQVYFKPGARVALYHAGAAAGSAVIRRGMWNGSEPLYTLPRCRALRPLAAATLDAPPDGATLEMIATSDPLPAGDARAITGPADLDSARAVAARAAQRGGLTAAARAELDLSVRAVRTGATGWPTLVASYMERGIEPSGRARHLFVVADSGSAGGATAAYAPSFTYAARDSAPEFRRLLDHVDLTGDGVDELILEAWQRGGDSYLLVMRYVGGRWAEMARGANSWCADAPKS